ncbi:fumarylacetoacetate hydrolase family protein [Halomicrococcus sp. NG-SE-24]|uniref:fumarylacetoacetate hydrolase family protein n=1 Tax=Halomicrococcus sp. NG-SE-24 TaxID=3436928 RepID=UPI003D998E22
MPVARIDTGSEVLTGEFDNGTVTVAQETYTLGEEATLLPPCQPQTVYCLGRNYPSYLEENAEVIQSNLSHDAEFPDEVHFFLKGGTSVVGPGEPIPYPTFSDSLGYAGELAAVIDQECKHVNATDVSDVVRGYTILNDLDAKDQTGITKMKVFDASAPLGPVIADVDPLSLEMRTTINGEVRQESRTSEMHRGPSQAIAELSHRVTLQPGDVIAFGSPANPGFLDPGDTVEVWYEGIGTLRNTVVSPS